MACTHPTFRRTHTLAGFLPFFLRLCVLCNRTRGEDAAVWAIDLEQMEKMLAKKLKRTRRGTTHDTNEAHIRYINDYLGGKTGHPLVVSVEPERLNERISIQQGLFMFPCDLCSPFTANLARTFDAKVEDFDETNVKPLDGILMNQIENHKVTALKIILRPDIHREALDDLHKMNVTSATLFPDLTDSRGLFIITCASCRQQTQFPSYSQP